MHKFESTPSALDLRDPSNRVNIALVKPGEEILVIVRVNDNPTGVKFIHAVGALSNDGKSFSITVTKDDGTPQTHHFCYRELWKTLSVLDEPAFIE